LVGAVVAEFTASGSTGGLGSSIIVANANSNLPQIYAAVACLAVIGLVLSALVVVFERRLLSWHWSANVRLN
jgi:NitT/TauT family transport system permease protein